MFQVVYREIPKTAEGTLFDKVLAEVCSSNGSSIITIISSSSNSNHNKSRLGADSDTDSAGLLTGEVQWTRTWREEGKPQIRRLHPIVRRLRRSTC